MASFASVGSVGRSTRAGDITHHSPARVARALLGGYCGASPPPTMARMLQRNSISTMAMPPLANSRRNCEADREEVHGNGGRQAAVGRQRHNACLIGRTTSIQSVTFR